MELVPILGIDPGASAGGAVLLDASGELALAHLSWRRRQRDKRQVWEVRSSGMWHRDVIVPDLHRVGLMIATLVPMSARLVVEDLFGRGSTLKILAEACGEVKGPLRRIQVGPELRVLASVWRPLVLGCSSRTRADAAEALAVAWARSTIKGLERVDNGHVAEAAAIARWGWLQ